MKLFNHLQKILSRRGAGFFVLLDPDRASTRKLASSAASAIEAGADGILVGSSILLTDNFDRGVKTIKKAVGETPVIIFPGNVNMVSRYADGILFLSLVSGRNSNLLIGEHVKAAPLIRKYGIEAIPTGYLIFDSGKMTSVLYMSNSLPIPSDKPDIACAHALAAEYLGMKMLFTDAGSGADSPVPDEVIGAIRDYVSLPIIVGGGIKQPAVAQEKVRAGASFVVIGDVLEKRGSQKLAREFADAIHRK
ncbi:MAG: geranylgeranylglyceryl phosphate synthase [candidate division Zixibacteria bacterium DG_27]|nr:MAG: geranylgeranylglyceryl phosphate synthase [candidate division Zixibacteria bacterium DG_27]